MEFQTRSEETGLKYFDNLYKAIEESKRDETIWKISFSLPTGERVRLVKEGYTFVYSPLSVGKYKIPGSAT